MWTSESLPVVSYNKTWDLLSRSLSTSLLQLISIGLCHYEVFRIRRKQHWLLFRWQISFSLYVTWKTVVLFLVTHWKSCLSYVEHHINITMTPTGLFIPHYPTDLGYAMQYLYTLSPIDHGLSRICSNKNIPFLDWYSYIPNYSMQNSHPAKWQLCWSQRPWGLRRRSVVVRCLGSRVPIAVSACIFASCVCRVLCK